MMFKVFKQIYSQDRNQTADLLKGFAVLMMIQVHVMELFAKEEIRQNLIGQFSLFLGGPLAAPLFMAVMGFYLFYSKKNFRDNLKRGLYLILGGILLNIGLNLHLLILYLLGKVDIEPLRFILGADILPLAGLSIIFISLIKNISKTSFYSTPIISLLIIIFILILHSISVELRTSDQTTTYIQAFFFGNLEWSYFPVLPWTVYPLIGFLYGAIKNYLEREESYKDFFALVSAVITFITITYGIDIASNLKNYYHHDWVYSLWIFQFLILLTYGLDKLEGFYGKAAFMIYLKWLGENVTPVYVFQWLLIGNIATAIFQTQNELGLSLWFVIVTVLTSLLVFAYERWMGVRKLTRFQV